MPHSHSRARKRGHKIEAGSKREKKKRQNEERKKMTAIKEENNRQVDTSVRLNDSQRNEGTKRSSETINRRSSRQKSRGQMEIRECQEKRRPCGLLCAHLQDV